MSVNELHNMLTAMKISITLDTCLLMIDLLETDSRKNTKPQMEMIVKRIISPTNRIIKPSN